MNNYIAGCCSILIYSDVVSVDEISKIMQTEPTNRVKKGELLSRKLNTYAPRNGWFYKKEFNDLECIDCAMQHIAEVCIKAIDEINNSKYLDVHLRCFVNSELAQVGYVFSPKTLFLLEKINHGLEITFFSCGGIEDV